MTKHGTPPSLGTDPDGYAVPIDADKLVESRLLIAATSGQGKSWALRRILEQTHGHVQHIVIDPEGEFYTLREIFDYVLARAGNERERDCPADVRSAELLARRLLELRVSTVVDIYDLKPDQRTIFVKIFLESLMEAPRSLWHPVLVILDEAHLFAPQSGDSQSGAAVADLMGRGRKRGFSGCVASQRFSRVHKDVAAMCKNVLIGGFTLDVDVTRAADSLGFVGREAAARIRELLPGQFFVQGPAFCREVRQVKIGAVQTTHPRAGQKAPLPAIPRSTIKSALGQLADLPAEVDRKLKTEADLRTELGKLEAEISRRDREAAKSTINPQVVENARRMGFEDAQRQFDKFLDDLKRKLVFGPTPLLAYQPDHSNGQNDLPEIKASDRTGGAFSISEPFPAVLGTNKPIQIPPETIETDGMPPKLPAGARRLLAAALTWYGKGLSEGRWRAAAQLKKSGSYDTYKSKLVTLGLVENRNGLIYATKLAVDSFGGNLPPAPLNTKEVLDAWAPKFSAGARRMLDVMIRNNRAMTKQEISEGAGVSSDGGSFDTYLSQLRTAELIVKTGKMFEVNRETLFL
jgi:hypothetical protein